MGVHSSRDLDNVRRAAAVVRTCCGARPPGGSGAPAPSAAVVVRDRGEVRRAVQVGEASVGPWAVPAARQALRRTRDHEARRSLTACGTLPAWRHMRRPPARR